MASIQRHVGEVQSLRISFISCDCLQEDVTLFDASNPGGKYKVSTGILYVLELYRMLMININSILHILFYIQIISTYLSNERNIAGETV